MTSQPDKSHSNQQKLAVLLWMEGHSGFMLPDELKDVPGMSEEQVSRLLSTLLEDGFVRETRIFRGPAYQVTRNGNAFVLTGLIEETSLNELDETILLTVCLEDNVAVTGGLLLSWIRAEESDMVESCTELCACHLLSVKNEVEDWSDRVFSITTEGYRLVVSILLQRIHRIGRNVCRIAARDSAARVQVCHLVDELLEEFALLPPPKLIIPKWIAALLADDPKLGSDQLMKWFMLQENRRLHYRFPTYVKYDKLPADEKSQWNADWGIQNGLRVGNVDRWQEAEQVAVSTISRRYKGNYLLRNRNQYDT